MKEVADFIEPFRQMWDDRFNKLEAVMKEYQTKKRLWYVAGSLKKQPAYKLIKNGSLGIDETVQAAVASGINLLWWGITQQDKK